MSKPTFHLFGIMTVQREGREVPVTLKGTLLPGNPPSLSDIVAKANGQIIELTAGEHYLAANCLYDELQAAYAA